ncbi:hypothetical protein QEZ54_26805 [Catellatospora sp. KI3]|uniref:hypothetical protein n=1 Tax=Catellatospora sp. KI3 TaxID=3041620 RepID=UPI002482F3F6|nr:hypothetical protein [Catellatospora sp. KI3]MDI1464584.1 hypothetical protein [Catellatospora sp. KI3]
MFKQREKDRQRLTPFSRERNQYLLIVPVVGYLIARGEPLGFLLLLLFAGSFIRFLRTGIFATDSTLRVSGGPYFSARFDEVVAFTVRRDERGHRALWIDLVDGRRYPTPVGLDPGQNTIMMSQSQLDALVANLDFRRSAATGRTPAPAVG